DVEAIGLVKFDFLGLATLTILELAKDFIVARHPARKDFSFETIPLDDSKVYKLFSDGLTESVFQFESTGMQKMLKEAKPSRLEDLIALNALYRPGPMDLIPTFVARKHGKETVEYPHPLTEPVLSETYGIMVYQEQVMQTAQVLGGYSLGGADMLRRAMGKKKPEEMAKQRLTFREGAALKGINEAKADEVFDLMEKFAGYGFNKSHAAAYSLLAYHTAWLKVHFTAEFFAANMTIEMDDTDKLKVLLNDAKLFNIAFQPPNVNLGVYRFEPIHNKLINYGLGAIKGTGQGAIEAIVRARADGPFTSFFDFCARVDRKAVNKRVVEALIKAGGFDELEADRARLLASVALGYTYADNLAQNVNQGGLFDFDDTHGSSTAEPDLVNVEPWGIKERLSLEKTALGFYLSGHLFDQAETELRKMVKRRIVDLQDSREPVTVSGIIGDMRVINGQRGRVAIFKLDDKTDAIEAVATEELLNANKELIAEDELVIAVGKVQNDRFSGGLRMNVQQVFGLAAARARFGRYLRTAPNTPAQAVVELIKNWPAKQVQTEQGTLTQGVELRIPIRRDGAAAELGLGGAGKFWPSDEAMEQLKPAEIVYDAGG
ncbi:MAG: DNA polymerase III subunit alpha, partial [Burkholderiaceae bacterium]